MDAVGGCEADAGDDIGSEALLLGQAVLPEHLAEKHGCLGLRQGHADTGARAVAKRQVADAGVVDEGSAVLPTVGNNNKDNDEEEGIPQQM